MDSDLCPFALHHHRIPILSYDMLTVKESFVIRVVYVVVGLAFVHPLKSGGALLGLQLVCELWRHGNMG